jgi:hypothetical protein
MPSPEQPAARADSPQRNGPSEIAMAFDGSVKSHETRSSLPSQRITETPKCFHLGA